MTTRMDPSSPFWVAYARLSQSVGAATCTRDLSAPGRRPRSERLDEPAVDYEVSPGYVAGALASEHDHQVGHLLRIGEATCRGLLRLFGRHRAGVPALSPGH